MNVTEVRDPDFKNAFPGIFNFTVGILIQALVQEIFPSTDRIVKPPVKPSVCHFSEFYNPDDYAGGCKREERRIKIVEDAVQIILTDFSDELVSLFYADFDEAQGMAS